MPETVIQGYRFFLHAKLVRSKPEGFRLRQSCQQGSGPDAWRLYRRILFQA